MQQPTALEMLDDDKNTGVQHDEIAPAPARQQGVDPIHDDAAVILQRAGPIEFTVQEDRQVLRKIDYRVLVPMMIIYTLVHLDKNAVSYGAVFDLQTATGLVGTQYAWLTSCIYLAQLVSQPLSSYALVRFRLGKWVTANVLCWGICVCCMGAATNFTGLIITRTLMGAFEATVSPAFIAVVQLWWRRREQTYRNTFWLMSSSIASMIGPLAAFGIGHVQTGIQPYQGIFIFLGCITVVLAPFLMYFMPDDIASAKFLNEREKAIAVERLRANNTGTKTSQWKSSQVWEAFKDPKTWGWGLMLMLAAIPSSGIGAFGGLITKGFGFNSFQTILFQIPVSFLNASILLISTWVINRVNLRFPVIAFLVLLPIAGAIGDLYISRTNPNALLGAYYVVMQYTVIQPLLYSWANSNAAGTTKQRVIGGIMFVCQCAGNTAGPQVYLTSEAPIYRTGLLVDIGCWSGLFVLIICMGFYLRLLNSRQEKRREAMGRVARIEDTSIMTIEAAAAYNKSLAALQETDINQHAFEDQTDFENADFIYVL